MDKKRIMFVCQSLGNGGAERVVSIISDELASRNFAIYVLPLTNDARSYELADSVKVITPDKICANGVKGKFARIMEIRRQIIKNHIDTVIAFSHYNAMFTVIAALGMSVKVIGSERNDPAQLKSRRILNAVRNVLYRKLDVLVCQTNEAKEYFPEVIQKKAVIILNPLKDNLPEPFLGEREKEIVSFCRLEKQKNLYMLINAVQMLFADFKEYRLVIYGEGSEKEKLLAYIDEKGLQDNVVIRPFAKDIHEKVRKSACFALSSDYEGLSNSMLEALALGLPTVVTDCPCGGARMVIKDGVNGFLVPVGDAGAMYQTIKYVLENPTAVKSVTNVALTIRKDLSAKNIAEQWIGLL